MADADSFALARGGARQLCCGFYAVGSVHRWQAVLQAPRTARRRCRAPVAPRSPARKPFRAPIRDTPFPFSPRDDTEFRSWPPGGDGVAVTVRPGAKLTVDDVCDELGIARSTFYDWRQKGRGPRCIRLPNGSLRIRRSDFENWLSDCEVN
ncbi:helix-turn-helix transcriptional regulator [Streptomyces sp. CH6]|uniref:helix-turn-helix transcriptional regulator n=1 Tax=unclassified Streptomyces TaxID=2593676 RepID=UPI003D08F3AD